MPFCRFLPGFLAAIYKVESSGNGECRPARGLVRRSEKREERIEQQLRRVLEAGKVRTRGYGNRALVTTPEALQQS
jgi:hypothetical protein